MKARIFSFTVPLAAALFMFFYLLDVGYESSMRGLDLSWHAMLGYAHENRLQHGSQIIFNYGPLSFIESGIYFEHTHREKLLYRAAYLLIVGIGCLAVLHIRSAWALLAWCGLTLHLIMWRDVYLLLPALLLCHHECRREQGNAAQLAISLLLAFGAAFACLVKANAMFLTLPAIVLASIYRFTVRDYRPIVPVCFAVSIVLLFWLSGQHVSGFFGFVRGYLDVSLAYGADMGLPAPFALHAAFIVGAAAVVATTLRVTHPASTVLGLLTLGYLLVAYKMGFVRHGAHPGAAFLALAFVCVVHLWGPGGDLLARNKRRVLAAVAVAAASLVTYILAVLLPHGAVIKGYVHVVEHRIRYVVDPGYRAVQDAESRRRYGMALTEARSAIPFVDMEGPIDIFPFEFSLAYASGLPIATRPAFQSYYATSRHMSAHNADFLASPQAPRSVVFSVTPIDGRYAALEDPLTLRAYRQHYQVDRQTPNALLLTRRASPLAQSALCRTSEVGFDLPLLIPWVGPDQAVWAEMDVSTTWLGRIVSVLTGPPILRMTIATPMGSTDFRYLREAGKTGFLLSPALVSTEAAANFFNGESRPEDNVLGLSIHQPSAAMPWFDEKITVKLCVLSWDSAHKAGQ
ncbi:hypothetical protein [Acidovorax radicis]|uniref:hypothetical protein n=1 Tax=Acidovorax radicis TaxID=758826 RepID=UPI001CF84D6D|nr:hypothetical protein [Acidovorax radicis]UCU98565.1 hypothetical protein KI609_19010 [Acidovorax radicis]